MIKLNPLRLKACSAILFWWFTSSSLLQNNLHGQANAINPASELAKHYDPDPPSGHIGLDLIRISDLPALVDLIAAASSPASIYLVHIVYAGTYPNVMPVMRDSGGEYTGGTFNFLNPKDPSQTLKSVPYKIYLGHPTPHIGALGNKAIYYICVGLGLSGQSLITENPTTLTPPESWVPGIAAVLASLSRGGAVNMQTLLSQDNVKFLKLMLDNKGLSDLKNPDNALQLLQKFPTLLKEGDPYTGAYFTALLIDANRRNETPVIDLLNSLVKNNKSPFVAGAIALGITKAITRDRTVPSRETILQFSSIKDLIRQQIPATGKDQWEVAYYATYQSSSDSAYKVPVAKPATAPPTAGSSAPTPADSGSPPPPAAR